MTRARSPVFFGTHGVQDTPEGRTALIILVMFPVVARLQSGGAGERRIARLLCETFITDIDDSLREMGVGDLSVPRKVKRAAQALGERCLAYSRAAASPDAVGALSHELSITLPGLETRPDGAEALARSTLNFANALSAIPTIELLAEPASLPTFTEMALRGTGDVR